MTRANLPKEPNSGSVHAGTRSQLRDVAKEAGEQTNQRVHLANAPRSPDELPRVLVNRTRASQDSLLRDEIQMSSVRSKCVQ